MNRRKLLIALFEVGPLVTFCVAKDQGKGKGKNKKENQQGDDQGGDHDSHYFRRDDYDAVRRITPPTPIFPPVCGKNTTERAHCHRDGKRRFSHFLPNSFGYFLLRRILSGATLMGSLLCTTEIPGSYSIRST